MTQTEARGLIIAEWHLLPLEDRRTEAQAVQFAIGASRRFPFRCAGDPYKIVRDWLLRDQSLRG
jgi:hypothetical protein